MNVQGSNVSQLLIVFKSQTIFYGDREEMGLLSQLNFTENHRQIIVIDALIQSFCGHSFMSVSKFF